jgi:hypothetical protein
VDGRDPVQHRAEAQVMTTALAFGDDDDEQVRAAAAAALLVSAAGMLCALAAAGVPHDRLGGCNP